MMGPIASEAPKRVLVVGGAYGGVSFIISLLDQLDKTETAPRQGPPPVHITLIDQRDGFFHSVGTPLAHVSDVHTDPFWKTFDSLAPLARPNVFVKQGTVIEINLESNIAFYLAGNEPDKKASLTFDHVVVASGLQRSWPCAPEALGKQGYLRQALDLIETMQKKKRVVVIGAGAVGVEVAAEIKDNYPSSQVWLVHSRSELLSNEPLPSEFKQKALDMLEALGVNVVLNQRAHVRPVDGKSDTVVLSGGHTIESAVVFAAGSKWTPCTGMLPAWAVNSEGYVRVSPQLQIMNANGEPTKHYAIGDVAAWTGIRRAGGALAMGRYAAVSLVKSWTMEPHTETAQSEAYPETPPMIALAIGSTAVSYNPVAGVKAGKEVMDMMFGKDLGWSIVQSYLGLNHQIEC